MLFYFKYVYCTRFSNLSNVCSNIFLLHRFYPVDFNCSVGKIMRISTLILSYLTAFCAPVWFYSIILQLWDFSAKGPIFSSPCISSLTFLTNQTISTTPSRSTSPSPSHTVTCGSHDGHVYCLNGNDGSLLWQFQTTGKVFSTPFVFDGTSWGLRTLAAVCSTDGKVWVLDGETGTLKATLSLPGELFSSPVVWGHNLVVGCRNDYVYCLELTKKWLIIIIHVQFFWVIPKSAY